MKVKIFDSILDAYQAEEIAQDCGLTSEQEAATLWFNEVYYDGSWTVEDMPKYRRFIGTIEGGELYYDYGAQYYFLVSK